jgi:dolichyl-phosphate beta-glucosyltransferase
MPSTKHSQKRLDLSIVIPALNEEKRIGKTLDELAQYLKTEPTFKAKEVEVVVVSADSHDRTHEIVSQKSKLFKNFAFLKPGPKVGKGRDVQYGMLRAKGKAILFMDADLATPLHHLKKFYKAYEKGAHVVVGTRNLRKHHSSLLRRSIANAGNLLFRVADGVWIEDSQCGFKLFTTDAAQLCFSKMTIQKWGFDMEILAIAKANKLTVVSYRVNDWKDMPDSTFDGNVVKNSVHALKDLAHIARHRFAGHYRKQQQG